VTAETRIDRRLPVGVATATRVVRALLDRGVPLGPLWLVRTQGRSSGRPAATPVAVVHHDGREWLVSPFGEVGWVLNYRANGVVSLVRGRASRPIELVEVHDERRGAVLRRFRSSFRLVPFVRQAFTARPGDGVAAFAAEADRHPVFLAQPAESPAA
jgi:deazaflavin-dependent oxidoreductase (nitroreductase family)